MASPVTLRLDDRTRRRLARLAKDRGCSASDVLRAALDEWLQKNERTTIYESVADLVGIVRGGDPRRSTDIGRGVTRLLKGRR